MDFLPCDGMTSLDVPEPQMTLSKSYESGCEILGLRTKGRSQSLVAMCVFL